jgi:hypothetical protein
MDVALAERPGDLAGDVMRAFDEIGHHPMLRMPFRRPGGQSRKHAHGLSSAALSSV